MPEKESFDIDGLMVFEGNYTAKDQDGNVVAGVITPDRYKPKSREPLSSDQTGRYTNTSAYWKDHSDIVPANGDIYIYSDGGTIEQGGVTINVPKIKIGDGVTTIDNLPFTDSDIQGGTAGTLNTTNTTAQTPASSESLSGTVNLHKVAKTGEYSDLIHAPDVNDATLTIQKNSTTIDTFSANASQDKTINITVPTTASDVGALPSSTKYAASLLLSIDSSTYVVTAQLKDQDGNNLGNAQTIDLPLESVVVSGSYNAQTKKVVLTLQNGSTIEFSVADLVAGLQSEITAQNPLSADLVTDGTTNKVLTAAEKTKLAGIEDGAEVNVQSDWNQSDNTADDYIKNKPSLANVATSGDYNDLSHKLEAGDNILIKNTHLPIGHEELEYISNGSNTRVNTSVTPSVDNIKVELVVKPTSGVWRIFQSAGTSMNTCGFTGGISDYSIIWQYRGETIVTSSTLRNTEHYMLIQATAANGSVELYVKDLYTGEESTNTGTYTYGSAGYPAQFSLFGNVSGLYASSGNRVASLKFWVDDVLQLDYVPCKRMQDNVVGFYNKVTGNLITESTGTINAGTLAKNNVINVTGLAEVATSGDYDDLTNKPAIPAAQVNSDWNATTGVAKILNKPAVAQPMYATFEINNNVVTCDKTVHEMAEWLYNGNIVIATLSLYDGIKLETVSYVYEENQSASIFLSSVFITSDGISYIFFSESNYSNNTWSADTWRYSEQKLDYSNLSNLPQIPAAQVQTDWNATSGMGVLLNKPTIPDSTSDLTNDSGFITNSDLPAIDTALSETSTNPVQNKAINVLTRKLWYKVDIVPRLGNEYAAKNNQISNGVWSASTTYKHWPVPVDGMRAASVTANSSDYAILTFLKTYNSTTGTPDFATGWSGNTTVNAGQTRILKVPSDANWMIVMTGRNNARKPSQLLLTGVGVTEYNGTSSQYVMGDGSLGSVGSVTIYSGSSSPASATGADGDIYIQEVV